MQKKSFGILIAILTVLLLAACFTDTVDPDEIARIVSQTQTALAQAGGQDTAPPPPPPPADTQPPVPEKTEPPAPSDRCQHFNPETSKFVIHSIKWGDENFVMYVKVDGEVPGLAMPVEGDEAPWIYEGTIGGLESLGCRVYEGDVYKGRIYCLYPIDQTYYNTAQPFELKVNGCDIPISSHPRLSLIVPEPEEQVASTQDPGCGKAPDSCGAAYANWCACTGGNYFCLGGWPFDFPMCWPDISP